MCHAYALFVGHHIFGKALLRSGILAYVILLAVTTGVWYLNMNVAIKVVVSHKGRETRYG